MEGVYKDYMAVKKQFSNDAVTYKHPIPLFRFTLDYKTKGEHCPYPPTIDPNNWTELTKQEIKAHEERMTIRGRLRRHYYKLMYHPVHYKHFSVAKADPAVSRYMKANEIYFTRFSINGMHRATKTEFLFMFFSFAIPAYFFWRAISPGSFHAYQHRPILEPL